MTATHPVNRADKFEQVAGRICQTAEWERQSIPVATARTLLHTHLKHLARSWGVSTDEALDSLNLHDAEEIARKYLAGITTIY